MASKKKEKEKVKKYDATLKTALMYFYTHVTVYMYLHAEGRLDEI